MAAKKHVHKYHRITLGTVGQVWACALKNTNCTHFLPKYMETDILGRKSICWECEKEFQLGPMSIQNDRPICLNCSDDAPLVRAIEDKPINDAFARFVHGAAHKGEKS